MRHISDDNISIQFVPTRLNAAPVVFRGMTGRELLFMTAAGLAFGLAPGLVGAWAVGSIAMLATVMAICAGAAIWFGGAVMRRLRRGRPEHWLYRRIQWELARMGYNPAGLIMEKAVYRAGRDRRHPVHPKLKLK